MAEKCYINISTSPNLCHRTTLLNTDVPNCHITLEFIILTQSLATELSYNKFKYGLFNRAVSSTTYRLNSVRIYAWNVPRMHWQKRVDDGATSRQRHQWSTGQAAPTRLSDVFWIPGGQLSWIGKPSPAARSRCCSRLGSGPANSVASVGGMKSGVSCSRKMPVSRAWWPLPSTRSIDPVQSVVANKVSKHRLIQFLVRNSLRKQIEP